MTMPVPSQSPRSLRMPQEARGKAPLSDHGGLAIGPLETVPAPAETRQGFWLALIRCSAAVILYAVVCAACGMVFLAAGLDPREVHLGLGGGK